MRSLKLLLGILLLAGCSSCEKKPFDFRNKYTGDYDLTVNYSHWQMGQATETGTFEYQGKISYNKKEDEKSGKKADKTGIVRLEFKESYVIELTINKEGELTPQCSGTKTGEFSNKDNFSLTYSTSCPGGAMGGGTNYTISGRRH